ncbi:MAG: hypothetical protein HY711_08240, partial [Candidatus Melainabacteria bacterium]|nr:hypothetical protein [Candidatus Melainabacteria bacterium]
QALRGLRVRAHLRAYLRRGMRTVSKRRSIGSSVEAGEFVRAKNPGIFACFLIFLARHRTPSCRRTEFDTTANFFWPIVPPYTVAYMEFANQVSHANSHDAIHRSTDSRTRYYPDEAPRLGQATSENVCMYALIRHLQITQYDE